MVVFTILEQTTFLEKRMYTQANSGVLALILVALLLLLIVGGVLIEVAVKIMKSKGDLRRARRLGWRGWRIFQAAAIGLVLHFSILVYTDIITIV